MAPSARYLGRVLKRAPVRAGFVAAKPRWNPAPQSDEGYTVVVGVKHELVPIMHATLDLMLRADLPSLHEIIVVFDRTRTDALDAEVARLRRAYPGRRVRVRYYSPWQYRLARFFTLPWFYCCLNWCLGIEATTSDTVLLHDLDAMLLEPDVLEARYHRMRELGVDWYGDSPRVGRGALESDGFAATWEMFLDRTHVLDNHRPVGLMNRMGRIGDRVVDFDITIWAQHRGGRTLVEPMGDERFVHPSQVIHQWTEMQRQGVLEPLPGMMILFALYFLAMGGAPGPMEAFTRAAPDAPPTRVPVADHAIDCSAMTGEFVSWLHDEIGRIEHHEHGGVRPEVDAFLGAVASLRVRA